MKSQKKYRFYITVVLSIAGFYLSEAQDSNNRNHKNTVDVSYEKVRITKKEVSNDEPSADLNKAENTEKNSITRSAVPTTNEAGSTAGGLSVSLSGAASYSIPIMVPPGIKDVAPNLKLHYSSQNSNGLAGWGWNVSGLSTISRMPATNYYDDQHDGIDFKDDRFSLDGQRLILKSGSYGADRSVYQTENYSNIKVIAYRKSPFGSSYGPRYFIVYYPDGTRAWYGSFDNSRSRLEWAICRWQDPQGNYIDYNYKSDNGLLSINKITYGGRRESTSSMHQIEFSYTKRTRPEQIFVGGHSFKRTHLLKQIQITTHGNQYRKYLLTHNTNSLGYQRLTTVTESNAQNKALNPIIFNYNNTSAGFKPRIESKYLYPSFYYEKRDLIAGEFNGDGRTDVVIFDKEKKNELYLHTGLFENQNTLAHKIKTAKFSNVFPSTFLYSNGKLADRQGITLVHEIKSSFRNPNSTVRFRTFAKKSSGILHQYDKVWEAPKYSTDSYCNNSSLHAISKKYISGDFNGDGLTDVLAIEKPYTAYTCTKAYPYCDGEPRTPPPTVQTIPTTDLKNQPIGVRSESNSRSCCSCEPTYHNSRYSKVHFIDLDRNKTTDFATEAGYLLRGGLQVKSQLKVADHNGDGKQDIYHFQEGEVYIYTLSNTNKLILIDWVYDNAIRLDFSILLGDYNGDGKTDFLVPTATNSNSWTYFISKGKKFFKETKKMPFRYSQDHPSSGTNISVDGIRMYKPYYEYRYTPQDVNGDGKTDIVVHQVVTPNFSYDKSVERIYVYKNLQNSSGQTPIFGLETTFSKKNGGVNKFGMPIFLEANRTNGNLEYAYISTNTIYAYELTKDSRIDMALKSITNNGVQTAISYQSLGERSNQNDLVYTSSSNQTYPYVNVNTSNTFLLVEKLSESGAGIKRYQDFLYEGAIANIHMGFIGFLKTKRSNWYGNDVSKLWTISKHDPQKKGAVTEQWVSSSSYEGDTYISKTTNSFSTSLASNKVFTNVPTKVVLHDALKGITTTKSFTYNSYYNPLTERTVYPGGHDQLSYNYSNKPSAENQYYHIGRITKKIQRTTIGGNAFSTEEHYGYSNNLLKQRKVKGNGTSWNTTGFTYDAFGNVTSKTLNSSGMTARSETFTYDAKGCFLIKSTDIEGLSTKFTYDNFGNPISTTNPFNLKTSFSYDGWNRLISEKPYHGKTTFFYYDKLNNGGLKKTINYPKGADEVLEYNSFGWITKKSVLGINGKWTHQSFRYDEAGRITKESEPYFSTASQWNTVSYDLYGREIARRSYNGLVVNINYNGLVTVVNDGTKTLKTTKDGGGNIIKVEDPGGTVTYRYHGNGLMKSAHYGSHVVRTEIDGWGRKSKLIDPSAGSYTYRYNGLGELLEETTPKGATTYTYDAFGNITTKKMTGDETQMNLKYSYHSTTKLVTKIQGKNSRTNENYTYTYVYDNYKRLYITKEQNSKAYFEHKVLRDGYGRIYAEHYFSKNLANNVSSAVKIRNAFDPKSGILTEIKDFNTNASLWKLKDVDERGQAKELYLGNGMVKKRTYDQYGFLTQIVDRTMGSNPKLTLDIAYSFDTKRGNLKHRHNKKFNWKESFTYDHLDRLTHITGSVSRKQEYDNRGRIRSNSDLGSYSYATTDSYRLEAVDLNTKGDLYYQNHPLQEISYNAYKKPVSIRVKNTAKVDFDYGILQNRSHAYYGGEEDNKLDRRYHKHYSAIAPVEIEFDNQGNTKLITYIGGDAYSAPIAYIKQTKTGESNGYHYLHRDYLGSILAISDDSGTVLEQRQFGAWGAVDKFRQDTNEVAFAHSTTLLNRGYTGHEHFMGVALIHMNGRMYDAKLGRFLSPDNYIQEPFSTQSFNRYGYVWNNPLKFTDQSGEWIWIVGAIVGAYLGGVKANGGNLNPFSWDWNWQTIGSIIQGGIIGAVAGGGLDIAIFGKTFLGISNVAIGIGSALGGVGFTFDQYGSTDFYWETAAGGSGSVNISEGSPIQEEDPGTPNTNEPGGLEYLQDGGGQNGGIPSPADIMSKYPSYPGEYCSQAGNECAIRMSIALSGNGVDISGSDIFREIHNHNGVIHQPSAAALADWLSLSSQLGTPKIYTHPTVEWSFNDFSAKEGIIYFAHPHRGGTGPGHIDVISGGNIGSGFYDNKVIWFWEYKNGSYGR